MKRPSLRFKYIDFGKEYQNAIINADCIVKFTIRKNKERTIFRLSCHLNDGSVIYEEFDSEEKVVQCFVNVSNCLNNECYNKPKGEQCFCTE